MSNLRTLTVYSFSSLHNVVPKTEPSRSAQIRQEISRTETIGKRAKSPSVTLSRNRADVVQGVGTLAKPTFMLNCICFISRCFSLGFSRETSQCESIWIRNGHGFSSIRFILPNNGSGIRFMRLGFRSE